MFSGRPRIQMCLLRSAFIAEARGELLSLVLYQIYSNFNKKCFWGFETFRLQALPWFMKHFLLRDAAAFSPREVSMKK